MPDPIRVALVDDHEIARAGLRALLTGPDIEIVGEGSTGREAIALCAEYHPHVVLMDYRMPDMDGFTATQHITRDFPLTRVVIVSMHEDPDYALKARAAGAVAYLPKGTSRNEVLTVLHRAAAQEAGTGELMLGSELRDTTLFQVDAALRLGQFELHYQPQVALATGELTGCEALARWRKPNQELVLPTQFIPVVEESELATPFSRWVLETAVRQCRMWQDEGLNVPVSINMAARNLQEPDLVDAVQRTCREFDLPPHLLQIEITETGVMSDLQAAIDLLAELRRTGCRVSVDDFGTGQSSLAYLRQLPLDELKIDMSLVRDLGADSRATAIVATAVELGHHLSLHVVAEGVSHQAAWDHLLALRCDTAQGFLLSPALPLADFVAWAREHAARAV